VRGGVQACPAAGAGAIQEIATRIADAITQPRDCSLMSESPFKTVVRRPIVAKSTTIIGCWTMIELVTFAWNSVVKGILRGLLNSGDGRGGL
jgi:hypothetical protein